MLFSKQEFKDGLEFSVKLGAFLYLIIGLAIEISFTDLSFDLEWITFASVPLISFYLFRDVIRATMVFGANTFLHESLWFIEGGFKYTSGLGYPHIIIDYIVFPLFFIPLYCYLYHFDKIKLFLVISIYSLYMGIWDLAGLPDKIFTPDQYFSASYYSLLSWILISAIFIYNEWSSRSVIA